MPQAVSLSPVTRIEGHLAIHLETESQPDGAARVVGAQCEGEMYRGLERILEGRDPLDAQQITQRICGVCPISHGIASVMAQEMAYGTQPTHNGRLLQNLIQSANYLQSHILHFYHLAALDFVDVKAILKCQGQDPTLRALRAWVERAVAANDPLAGAPLLPRYEVDQYIKSDEVNWTLIAHYAQALQMRTIAHEMAAVFGAKLPHSTALIPTGVTQTPSIERVLSYRSRLDKVQTFVDNVYIPDLVTAAKAFPEYWDIGKGYGHYLSYGVFRMQDGPQGTPGKDLETFLPSGTVINGTYEPLNPEHIREFVGSSRFSSPTDLHPFQGQTEPDPSKGYSWLKSPRYRGVPVEVGPVARVMVGCARSPDGWMKKDLDQTLGSLGIPVDKMNSVMGRHLARGLEATWLIKQINRWLDEIEIDGPPAQDFEMPKQGRGYGLTEAPRGAVGHWLVIEDYRIKRYQCVVPTTWNCSPKDDKGQPGPVEKALAGTILKDPRQPLEAGRIVRSFDPCIACAVH